MSGKVLAACKAREAVAQQLRGQLMNGSRELADDEPRLDARLPSRPQIELDPVHESADGRRSCRTHSAPDDTWHPERERKRCEPLEDCHFGGEPLFEAAV